MEESTSDFLASLREEILHHKEKRAAFVLQKLAFVTALFGLGSVEFVSGIQSNWLLYAVPFVALAYDVYISAEDYKVKRIGTFCRIYRYATPAERDWERFVNQHREPIAVWASLIVTILASLASAVVLYEYNQSSNPQAWQVQIFQPWAFAAAFFVLLVFAYYFGLKSTLPKPHLLEEQAQELLAAPEEKLQEGLRDKLIVALILNSGITSIELLRLKIDDLNHKRNGKTALRIRYRTWRIIDFALRVIGRGRCNERLVPYTRPSEISNIVEKWKKIANIQEGAVFPGLAAGSIVPGWIQVWRVNRILKKYPIVVDGRIQPVSANEIRRTYARYLCQDGTELATIQQYLGCKNVKNILGYIGPIAARRVRKKRSLETLEAVFPKIIDAIGDDRFDSHGFILQLAHDHQALYVEALVAYADADRPIQIVHSEIVKSLLKYKHLLTKVGETTSKDIFGQKNICARWRRVK